MNWQPLLDLGSAIQATVVATGTATIQATAAVTSTATTVATAVVTGTTAAATAVVTGTTAAATAVVTGTATLAATAVTTIAPGTVITPTETATVVNIPTVLPTNTSPPGPFSTDYLGLPADPPLGLVSGIFLLVSLVLLVGGLYFYFLGKERWRKTHTLNYRIAGLWSVISSFLGGLGVLFVLFRFAGVLNERYWLYVVMVVILAVAAYAVYFFVREYPKQLAAWTKRQGARGGKATTRARSSTPTARQAAPPAAEGTAGPTRPAGTPGNPRGTSSRGERRRGKR